MKAAVGNLIGGERVVNTTRCHAITESGRRFERKVIRNMFSRLDYVCKEWGKIKFEKFESLKQN